MLAWRAGRSLWTRTEVGGLTAEEHSPAKTSPKWIVPLPTLPAGWPSLWSKPSCAGEFWSRWVQGGALSCSVYVNLVADKVKTACQYVTGVLRNRGRPSAVHLFVHLRLLGENRVGAASDCQQELRPEARRHRQVSFYDRACCKRCTRIFCSTVLLNAILCLCELKQGYLAYLESIPASAQILLPLLSFLGNWTWRGPSTRKRPPMATLADQSLLGRCQKISSYNFFRLPLLIDSTWTRWASSTISTISYGFDFYFFFTMKN